jgi:DNA-binding MarR family transcriptional regulator
MTDEIRKHLAFRMVTSLPKYSNWATTFRDFDTPYGKLGYRQMAILWLIRYENLPKDELTPTRIAAFQNVQPSVVTRALDKLAAGGYITRTHDEEDRRRINIAITDKGREASVYVERLYIDELTSSMAFLNDRQIAELASNVEILDDIVTELEQRRTEGRSAVRREGSSG